MNNKINSRTPEEIKKGLELCCVGRCSECPYREECDEHLACGGEMLPADVVLTDVLALIQQLEAAQPKWISAEERLPEDGQRVLIYDGGADQWKPCVSAAQFKKGRTSKEIARFPYQSIAPFDEWGNNKKPYCWFGDAHMCWFGQHVTHWMPLPEPPKKEKTTVEYFNESIDNFMAVESSRTMSRLREKKHD